MQKLLIALLLVLTPQLAGAQINLVDTNANYFEDFDSLDSFGTGCLKLPPGWTFSEFGSAANTSYRAGTGSATTSDTYSFGPLRSRDRALGSLASGTLTKVVYGLFFVNQSGSDINAMNVTYRGEQWRRGGSGAPDSLRCYFTTVRGTRIADSSNARWTEAPGLLFRSVSTLTGAGTLNGNDSMRVLNALIPLMLHPGDTLWMRWMDVNAAGSDDGLAIDSLSIRFQNGPVTQGNHPQLMAFSPDSNSSGLAPDLHLTLLFDRGVRPGGGHISVWNLENNQIDRIPAVDGQPGNSGREFVFTGIQFEPGSRYLVRFDSTAFDSSGYECSGFLGTGWTFRVAPVTILTPDGQVPVRMDLMLDGRVLLRSAVGDRAAHLRITAADGRVVRSEYLRIESGIRIVDPGLPRGACYGVSLQNAEFRVQRWLCVP